MHGFNYFSILDFAEEPYYGSGSGSGGGSIEENGEEGSGMGVVDYTPINESGPSTTHPVDPHGINKSSGTGSAPDTSDKETKSPIDPNKSNDIDSNSINHNSSGSSAVGTTSQMSLKRALFTYFLPIYLAWFGGLFSELL